MTTKTLAAAILKVNALPEAAQEQLGRELIARIEALDALRADLQIGIEQLDAGMGEEFDLDDVMKDARRILHERRDASSLLGP